MDGILCIGHFGNGYGYSRLGSLIYTADGMGEGWVAAIGCWKRKSELHWYEAKILGGDAAAFYWRRYCYHVWRLGYYHGGIGSEGGSVGGESKLEAGAALWGMLSFCAKKRVLLAATGQQGG